jgi:hypothetical protein
LGIVITGQIFFATLQGATDKNIPVHASFVASLKAALIYEILAFALVAGLVFFLKAPPASAHGAQGKPVTPVPATAEV